MLTYSTGQNNALTHSRQAKVGNLHMLWAKKGKAKMGKKARLGNPYLSLGLVYWIRAYAFVKKQAKP